MSCSGAAVGSGGMGVPMRTSRRPERNQRVCGRGASPRPMRATGRMGTLGLLGEQADAGAEGVELAVAAAGSFGEDEDGVAAVHRLAGVGEAAAEAA